MYGIFVFMKTTLVLNDDLYRQAKVVASGRGCTVSSIVEEALRLLLSIADPVQGPSIPMPSWDMGKPRVDVDDSRAIQEALDAGREPDDLR
jgi:hypothetical protein